uniref:Uncharacterized protein n=1 Tax=Acrobeloides nanus TaxID=290746 RepID=A0A914EAU7_9BILA
MLMLCFVQATQKRSIDDIPDSFLQEQLLFGFGKRFDPQYFLATKKRSLNAENEDYNDFADRIAKTRFFLDFRKRSYRPDLDHIEIQTRFDPTAFRHIGLRR